MGNRTMIEKRILHTISAFVMVFSLFATRLTVSVSAESSSTINNTPVKQKQVVDERGEEELPFEANHLHFGNNIVYLNTTPKPTGLQKNYVKDYYKVSAEERMGLVIVEFYSVDIENEAITAVLDQKDALLPRIWLTSPDGSRTLLSESDLTWETSDPEVIAIEDGVPVLVKEGTAELKATHERGSFTVQVEVAGGKTVKNFKTQSDNLFALDFEDGAYRVDKTYLWPTEKPGLLLTNKVTVKGGRIYQSGSQYYLATEDFEAKWSEIPGNAKDYGMLILSQGMILMEGDNLQGIVPGVIYRDGDQLWVYDGDSGEDIKAPTEDDSEWIDISELFEPYESEYDPGADTGPESDASFYYESQYNPYPGTIASNCTFAVWALANQAVGARLPNWGDAGNWYRRAGISGYKTGQIPAANSIIVWDHHVGYVTQVSEDGTMIYIKEGNFSGRYHEGWWPVSESRHGQKCYGYIYLTSDTGKVVEPETVMLEENLPYSEEEFLAFLETLELMPGERREEYSDDYDKGMIISYTGGELAKGSVVDYVVSLGEEPTVDIDDSALKQLIGMTKEQLLSWLSDHGLKPGKETVKESDEDDGIVTGVEKGSFKLGETVNYTISKKKKPEEEIIDPDPTADPAIEPTASPEATPEPEPSQEPEVTPVEPEPTVTPETSAETAAPEQTTEPVATPVASAAPVEEEVVETNQEVVVETPVPEQTPEPSVTPEPTPTTEGQSNEGS